MQENKRYTALIVDDSEMNREILKEILADELNIIEIDNGKDACEYMMNHSGELNIVILDLVMPGMDGFEVLKFMKYKHLLDTLPVIMISADSDGTNIERAFDLGVIDFLSRPFSERIVTRRVMTTIRLFKRQKELVDELDRQYKVDDMRIDDLTGLDYKQTFLNKVYTHLKGNPGDDLLMIAIDVDHFKLFNNYYGWEMGDRYLQLIAKYMKEFVQRYGGLAGYLGWFRGSARSFWHSATRYGTAPSWQSMRSGSRRRSASMRSRIRRRRSAAYTTMPRSRWRASKTTTPSGYPGMTIRCSRMSGMSLSFLWISSAARRQANLHSSSSPRSA